MQTEEETRPLNIPISVSANTLISILKSRHGETKKEIGKKALAIFLYLFTDLDVRDSKEFAKIASVVYSSSFPGAPLGIEPTLALKLWRELTRGLVAGSKKGALIKYLEEIK